MIRVGTFGRSAPGESWERAMAEVRRRITGGSRKRYRVRGRRVERDWWVYEVVPVKEPPPEPVVLTREEIVRMSQELPRCAQRSREYHGGTSKAAWPTQDLAYQAAKQFGGSAYKCPLPAPAIGKHWHVTNKRKKRWGW